jgi:hypothetical protein
LMACGHECVRDARAPMAASTLQKSMIYRVPLSRE